MLRRALPILAAAAATVALQPGSAWATPAQAPVATDLYQSYSAQGDAVLSDGRRVSATVSEIPWSDGRGSSAGMTLWVLPAPDCWATTLDCTTGTGFGVVSLNADDVGFDRSLSGVTLPDLAVTLNRADWGGGNWDRVEESVVVDVRLTGTGRSTRTAEHGTTCGDESSTCQATRVAVQRSGEASIDLDGLTGSGPAFLYFGKSIDAAAPKSPGDGPGDAPSDGPGHEPPLAPEPSPTVDEPLVEEPLAEEPVADVGN